MSDIKPIRVSDDEYNGCSDEQIRRAKERFLDIYDEESLRQVSDEEIIESRLSCNA